jgi:hypothetical protein
MTEALVLISKILPTHSFPLLYLITLFPAKTWKFWKTQNEESTKCYSRVSPKLTRTRKLFRAWNILTFSMQQSPSWEANRFSAGQEIPRILCNPKFHYRIHNCPPPVPTLSQLDPIHTPTSYFLKVHHDIIFPSTFGSPKWPLSLRFPHKRPEYASPSSHTRYMPRPSHSSRYIYTKRHGVTYRRTDIISTAVSTSNFEQNLSFRITDVHTDIINTV